MDTASEVCINPPHTDEHGSRSANTEMRPHQMMIILIMMIIMNTIASILQNHNSITGLITLNFKGSDILSHTPARPTEV